LMLAAGDLEKVKLLVERGANVNGAAKNRFTPLLVAAAMPGSAGVIEYLIAQGAKLQGPRKAQHEATPLAMAVLAHDAQSVRALLRARAKVDEKMWLIGTLPLTPVALAAAAEDVRTLEALLEAGANVEEPDEDGVTLLGWAAIGGRTEAARVLLRRGANVNAVAKNGFTPLLYAASVDFGDGEMVRLLVDAGADTTAKTPEGATALALAKRYSHVNLLGALGEPGAGR
jgi:ankyrin repeat protein